MNKSEFAKELAARAGLTGVQGQKITGDDGRDQVGAAQKLALVLAARPLDAAEG